ncbi:hypothetical protein [Burkholderia pseudomallei]|uniref:hypothetical protein n=1 Tax=Burkholderia pseudomallei TaxID=28450 RepID=UPI00100A29BA|nr:hypothetical protein [Burkholderia pseudomallei]
MTKIKKPEGIPLAAMAEDPGFKRNLKILIREKRSNEPLVDAIIDELVSNTNANLLSKEGQRKKATRPRPTKNDSGDALDGVIGTVAKDHPGERPGEIWPHLKTAIVEWSGDSVTETGADDSRRYTFRRGDQWDAITFGTFRKKLKLARSG